MTTLMDIARATGVSKMTVSNALRGKSNVSEATRKRILAAADRLHYQTNLAARALSSGRNGIIQLIVQDLDNPFYSKLALELSRAVDNAGLQMLTRQTLYSEENEKHALKSNSDLFCDGLILATPAISAVEAKQLAQNRPIVLIDDGSDTPILPTVFTPNYDGIYSVTRHLIEQGVRRPLLLGSHPAYLDGDACGNLAYYQRFCGARDALAEEGLAIDVAQCVAIDWTMPDARRAVNRLLDNGMQFDGIIAMSDTVAFGALRALADHSIRIPEDVKVTGFDGSTMSEFATPSLTTVDIDMAAMASIIIERLTEQLNAADKDADSNDDYVNASNASNTGNANAGTTNAGTAIITDAATATGAAGTSTDATSIAGVSAVGTGTSTVNTTTSAATGPTITIDTAPFTLRIRESSGGAN